MRRVESPWMKNHLPQNLVSSRFQIKTYLCKEKVKRPLNGTVHYEHPLLDQKLEID